MEFVVAEDCQLLGLRAGAIVFRNLRVGPASAELRAAITDEAARVPARFPNPSAIRAALEVAGFYELHRAVGANPRKESPSVERLLAFALKRGDLPAINGLVDAYNLVSVRTLLSLGAHDIDRIASPVTLRRLSGRETFTPLGRDTPAAVPVGEFGYVDAKNRLLCRLDVVQADFSKVTEATVNALLIIEGTPAHLPEAFRQALDQSVDLITRECGGAAEVAAGNF